MFSADILPVLDVNSSKKEEGWWFERGRRMWEEWRAKKSLVGGDGSLIRVWSVWSGANV